MTALYLHHSHPVWWQWVTHLFAHANLQHLSNNLFFLLVFGRFVEDTEGAGGVVAVYLLCGLGAGLASFLLSSRATVSVGASGAIFGLFATSVLLRLTSFNWRRLLESLVLGQFVVQQVLGEVKAQLGGGSLMAGGLKVSHLAHLGGALAGVLLVALLTRVPAPPNSAQLPP
uniref:Rhomboid-like protease n=1 Tax=Haematococcus lacustris TaxID=44745 RepID=A0A699Z5K2_HAELA